MSTPKNSRSAQLEKATRDMMVWHAAAMMSCKGYSVRAGHQKWPGAPPYPVNGWQPDVIATPAGGSQPLLFVVETCDSAGSETVRQKLLAFRGHGRLFVIVPPLCREGSFLNCPVAAVKKRLSEWGLAEVGVGTCDPETGALVCRV